MFDPPNCQFEDREHALETAVSELQQALAAERAKSRKYHDALKSEMAHTANLTGQRNKLQADLAAEQEAHKTTQQMFNEESVKVERLQKKIAEYGIEAEAERERADKKQRQCDILVDEIAARERERTALRAERDAAIERAERADAALEEVSDGLVYHDRITKALGILKPHLPYSRDGVIGRAIAALKGEATP